MRSRKRLLKKSRLYLIFDKSAFSRDALNIVKKLAESGVDMVQLRDKNSSAQAVLESAVTLNKGLRNTNTLFIVNDNPDIARLSGSDGLHIGQNDIPVQDARRMLGRDKLIGVSCYSLGQALKAQKEGADYIGIGPVFKTQTKRDSRRPIGVKGLKGLSRRIKIPVFAIGNINRANLAKVTSSGINRIALCRAILKNGDCFKSAQYFANKLKNLL
ncbi:MAG: thiamine phosphate synthase [Candidatus Omnitrophota bacterium]